MGLPFSALKFGGTGYKFLQFRAGQSLSIDSCVQTVFQIASMLLLLLPHPNSSTIDNIISFLDL